MCPLWSGSKPARVQNIHKVIMSKRLRMDDNSKMGVDDTSVDKESITNFLRSHIKEPGTLAVVIAREAAMIMTMFTFSLTTIMSPSDEAYDEAIRRVEGMHDFEKLSLKDKTRIVRLKACAIDDWNRPAAGMSIVQAILSFAAGLKTIKYAEDVKDPELHKHLNASDSDSRTLKISNTIKAAMGFVGGIDKDVIHALTFDPQKFEKHFMDLLDEQLPSIRLGESCNKLEIFDLETLSTFTVTSHLTTREKKLPCLPSPF